MSGRAARKARVRAQRAESLVRKHWLEEEQREYQAERCYAGLSQGMQCVLLRGHYEPNGHNASPHETECGIKWFGAQIPDSLLRKETKR